MSTRSVRLLILGGSRDERISTASARAQADGPSSVIELSGAALPFRRPSVPGRSRRRPITIQINDLEEAFPDNQLGGIRVVLTQAGYLLQKWLDSIGPRTRLILTADRAKLMRLAPEAEQRQGPWRHFEVVDVDRQPDGELDDFGAEDRDSPRPPVSPLEELLIRAYSSLSVEERLALCREALEQEPKSEIAALALASACREAQDQTGWRKALDRAHKLSPHWEAAYYEDGKFWLSCEDMERARAAFQRAAELMPTFSAAWSNLGATLGELDHPDAALRAFKQALACDPENFTILNNIGVVTRELGRLAESEEALRRVVSLAPDFVFGHYNLGHTRFLKADYRGALDAYEEGLRLDPEKNRRQACRLALVRLANEDIDGAERDLWATANQAPPDEREELLLEAYEIARALLGDDPTREPYRSFLERIATEITR